MTNDNEINVDDWPDTDGGPATYWLERAYDAIDLASDRDTVTWLVRDGKRIAAIVPVDTAQEVVTLESRVAELRSHAAHRRMTLEPVGDEASVVGLLDPDCRDGKHTSCVGGPCECICHGTLDLPPVTEVQRYRYEPGDRIIVHLPKGRDKMEDGVIVRDQVRLALGIPAEDVILILPDGFELGIMSPAEQGGD